jgi:hypothetical protein
MIWVVLFLIHALLIHSPLSLPLEAKLLLMTIPPIILTMEADRSWLRLGLGLLSLLLPNHITQSSHKLDRFLEIVCLRRKHWWI